VVATPIGNLEDITLRALRVLREVDLIAAEDTRRTARLLTHHGISTPTVSFHEHNARGRTPQLVDKLGSGLAIALVTDAGTPGVSDPGVELVSACIEAGIPVDPVPGVSAPLTAAVASGFPLHSLLVRGFAPYRSQDRKRFLETIADFDGVVTFFETPHRIADTLRDMATVLVDRPIVIARELTKVHQEFKRGTAATVLALLGEPRGEFTVVVGPQLPSVERVPAPADADVAHEFGEIAKQSGVARREAVNTVARKFNISTREAYAAIERVKQVGQDT
jgi:16S rRNA (cytidine1402-2'-O)-methyltransferase